jgi:hypothetical protein
MTGCLEGTHRVIRTLSYVGLSTRRDRLRPARSGVVATGLGYKNSSFGSLGGSLCSAMSSSDDRDRRPYVRSLFVGLIVAASTVTADLAAFVGHPDWT